MDADQILEQELLHAQNEWGLSQALDTWLMRVALSADEGARKMFEARRRRDLRLMAEKSLNEFVALRKRE